MNRITAKAVRYYGYLQGWKVYIDGVKYPREHGKFYTHMKPLEAIKYAMANDLLESVKTEY